MIDTIVIEPWQYILFWMIAIAFFTLGLLFGVAIGRKIWNEPLQDWEAAPDDDSWDEDPFAR